MDELADGWQPRVIKIPVGGLVRWKWGLYDIGNLEQSKIRVQQTMSKDRIEFNQIGFQSEVNAYAFTRQFFEKGID